MFRTHRLFALVIAGVALLAAPGAARAAIVNNGGFETGTFSGWPENYLNMPGPGLWSVYTGTTSPLTGQPIPAPPQGSHAAITDQMSTSRQILYQDVTLPSGGSLTQLVLTAYYRNTVIGFTSPETLSIASPNQQYRIDVMKPSAPIDSVASGDVLLNVLRTRVGDPMVLAPKVFTVNLSSFAGQTVRLRFAVAVTMSQLFAGVDGVSVVSNAFTIGTPIRNKKRGTAQVPLTLPDAGDVTVSGNGVKGSVASASKSIAVPAGSVNLVIKAKGKKKRKLNDTGKVKLQASIAYTPTGTTSPGTQTLQLKLKKKLKKKT